MNATVFILAVLSPLVVALIRKCQWPKEVVELVAVVIIVALVILGKFLDGALIWPLTESFWLELLGYFGAQQASYKLLWRNSAAVESLEQVGNPPAVADDNAGLWR